MRPITVPKFVFSSPELQQAFAIGFKKGYGRRGNLKVSEEQASEFLWTQLFTHLCHPKHGRIKLLDLINGQVLLVPVAKTNKSIFYSVRINKTKDKLISYDL